MSNNVKQPKKLAIIYILKILQEHSDADNPLTQTRISDLLMSEYEMSLDRKSVRHNLSMLIEAGYPVKYREDVTRTGKTGIEQTILSNWYYDHSDRFDQSELQVMIDSLLFSNYIPKKQCGDLVKKIAELGGELSRKRLSSTVNTVARRPENKSLFYTILQLGDAIAEKKQVCFHYCDLDIKMKPAPRRDENGKVRLYTVSPYKLVSLNGRYYLLGNSAAHEGISTYRLDRITDISMLDTKSRPINSVEDCMNGFDLSVYVSEHPNMWGGKAEGCTFRCPEYLMNDIIDTFGSNFSVSRLGDGMIEVRVRVSEEAMVHWAVQFCDKVEVTFPSDVRKRVAEIIKNAAEKYKG